MNRYWSPLLARLHPYVPGEQPTSTDVIKLNTNESPYGPSPRVIAALQAELDDRLRLYPPPESDALRAAIARHHGLTREHVFVGNGSDEVLAHAFQALLRHDLPILLPDISYSFYTTYCELYDVAYETVPLTDALELDPADYARPNGGIVFANPNAPTGRALGLADVERLVRASERVVLCDEAYVDYGAETAVPLVARHDNLLVVQTLSKSRALAGLRVGFAIGQPHLIEGLLRVKNSFNSYPLDRLAQAAAVAAIEDTAWLAETVGKVVATREQLAKDLAALGFDVLPSKTNFVFARHPQKPAAELSSALRAQGILVRHFKKPRIDEFLRITIGTPRQCEALVSALRGLL